MHRTALGLAAALLVTAALALVPSGSASARTHVFLGFNFWAPAPWYYAPPPIYYVAPPPPVYYVVPPPPVFYPPAVTYAPARAPAPYCREYR